MLISKREKTDKPIIIKCDLLKHRLYMVVGRTMFYSNEDFIVPNYYVLEYIKWLQENGFHVTVEQKEESSDIKSFKARLKNPPNLDEKKKHFHDEMDR